MGLCRDELLLGWPSPGSPYSRVREGIEVLDASTSSGSGVAVRMGDSGGAPMVRRSVCSFSTAMNLTHATDTPAARALCVDGRTVIASAHRMWSCEVHLNPNHLGGPGSKSMLSQFETESLIDRTAVTSKPHTPWFRNKEP